MFDDNLNDNDKIKINEILKSVSAASNYQGFPAFDEKQKNTYTMYSDVFIAAETFAKNGDTENERLCKEMLLKFPAAKIESRLNDTLKWLKEKGCYLELISFPLEKSKLWDATESGQAFQMETLLFDQAGYTKKPKSIVVTVDTWFVAIETTVSAHNSELLFDSSFPSFTPTIEANLRTLGGFLLTLALIQKQSSSIFNLSRLNDIVTDSIAEIEKENIKTHEAKIAEAELEAEKYRSNISDVENQIIQEQRIFAVKFRELYKIGIGQKRRILELKQQIAEKNGELFDEELAFESNAYAEYADYIDVELPETNVIFIGGHDSLISDLRDYYPEWTYTNRSDNRESDMPRNPIIYFIYLNSIKHDVTESGAATIPVATPKACVSSTNIMLLILEMKSEYAKIFLKNAEDSNK